VNIPCPVKLPCDCTASPFSNLSSEAPDLPFFFSTQFVKVLVPLGVAAPQSECMGICFNSNEADAQLCANVNAFLCATNGWTIPLPGATPLPPVPPPQSPQGGIGYAVFLNNAQTGSALCPDGNFSEFTVPAGFFAGSSQEEVDMAALSYANRQARLGQICLSAINPNCCEGAPLSLSITATGARLATGMNTNNWEVSMLPPGLDTTDGDITGNQLFITGTPTVPGNYVFFVTVTDPAGDSITVPYDLNVAGITGNPPDATTGNSYSSALATAGFTSPTFSLSSGALPPGLSMDSAGNITGTPTMAGTFSFTVTIVGM
jgi:hypothetical protein